MSLKYRGVGIRGRIKRTKCFASLTGGEEIN
jgi:hypothetical protein